jgi:NADH-quinone oxidoreductase subunit L
VSTLAISGLPFFSGFVSKDRVLAGALAYGMEHRMHLIIPILGFAAAGVTAFYMFRLLYMTFFGAARDEHKHHHAHEQPMIMVIPLMVLATLSLSLWFAGPTGLDFVDDKVMPVKWFDHAVENAQHSMSIAAHHGNEEIHHTAHHLALIFSLVVAGLGILLSSAIYLKGLINPDKLRRMFGPLHHILWHKYFFDELYVGFFIQKVLLGWNRLLAEFDNRVVDGIFVDGWAKVTLFVRSVVGKFDEVVVDRIGVDGTGDLVTVGGWVVRRFQTGRVQQYLIFSLVALGAVYWVLR